MHQFLRLLATLACVPIAWSAAESAPTLEWVKKLGGSGVSHVSGAATDAGGNFYIVGTTSSLDFPTTPAAAQRTAGGSPLVRINAATAVAEKLFPPALSALHVLAATPQNPARLYAAAADGVLGSLDAGSTWSPLATIAAGSNISSLAVDPSNGNVIYAATATQGMWKSLDGGLTWSAINSGIPAGSSGMITVLHVWIDPHAPQVVIASLQTGAVRTADGGASWSPVSSPAFNNLVFDPFLPGTVYAVAPSAIVKSTDDGQTFANLSALPGQALIASLIADPIHPGGLFAGAFAGGIFQSADSGVTWTLKSKAPTTFLAADPNSPALYSQSGVNGIVCSTDGFNTSSAIGPPEAGITQIVVAGSNVFEVAAASTDVFAVKFDNDGNIVYATYFGGSGQDSAAAMALGADGSLYVAGTTLSLDFPTTRGVYAAGPGAGSASFVLKLNPDGALGWSSYFADAQSTIQAIAVDAAGNPYIGGSSKGNLPTTPGAYQTKFQQSCVNTGLIGCVAGPTSAFVTKFNAQGSTLLYSTYIPNDTRKNTVTAAQALSVDASGNAWFGGQGNVVALNSSGSALLASTVQAGITIGAVALDAQSNLYATGSWAGGPTNTGVPPLVFPATPGAFQRGAQPSFPALPDQAPGGQTDAFVIKWDNTLSHILAATLLGGESADTGESIAVDPAGNVILSGETDSKAFPTHVPFQTSFSIHTGFVAGFDPSLSHLLFSTYLGDEHPFDAHAVALDGRGNILMAGYMLTGSATFFGLQPTQLLYFGGPVVANKIALPAPPAIRLDSVIHAASHMAAAIAPGEPIMAVGSGFGTDAQFVIDGAPLASTTASATSLVAVMPDGAKTTGGSVVQVSSGGTLSNPVFVPAAAASPGIFSTDGSGFGQGYILNSDGTLNSPANPAAAGSAITIFAAGIGLYTLDHGYAVAALAPSVYIDGFYAYGIAAVSGPVSGLPGNVYQLSVYVPNPAVTRPDLPNFHFPPQVSVRLVMGPVSPGNFANSAFVSQGGLALSVK